MRRWLLSLCFIGLSSGAFAADYGVPPLRGPIVPETPRFGRWSGAYGGGQVGYGAGHMYFDRAFDTANIFDPSNTFIAPLGSVSSWASFGTDRPAALSYGGFVGYNDDWEDAILGVEFNYNHTALTGNVADSTCYSDTNNPPCAPSITLGDTNAYDVTVNAAASARLTDYATFRGRLGWAYGDIMPYGMVALAIGRVETVRTATASGTPTGVGSAFVHTETLTDTHYPLGYAAGLGIDFLVSSKVFVRTEYEYLHLSHTTNIDLDVNTVRFAAGVKF